MIAAAPGHVDAVRRLVFDTLDTNQVAQLRAIGDALLSTLDADGQMTSLYERP